MVLENKEGEKVFSLNKNQINQVCLADGIPGKFRFVQEEVSKFQHINLVHAEITDEQFEILMNDYDWSNVKIIDLSGCTNITKKSLEMLSNLSSLKEVKLKESGVSQQDADEFNTRLASKSQ